MTIFDSVSNSARGFGGRLLSAITKIAPQVYQGIKIGAIVGRKVIDIGKAALGVAVTLPGVSTYAIAAAPYLSAADAGLSIIETGIRAGDAALRERDDAIDKIRSIRGIGPIKGKIPSVMTESGFTARAGVKPVRRGRT